MFPSRSRSSAEIGTAKPFVTEPFVQAPKIPVVELTPEPVSPPEPEVGPDLDIAREAARKAQEESKLKTDIIAKMPSCRGTRDGAFQSAERVEKGTDQEGEAATRR